MIDRYSGCGTEGYSGMQIPGFELLEKLGEGGMATVWKARQLSLDRIVAIKILSSRLSKDKADADRFLKEAQAMAALKHPGIIQVYDANVHEGVYYFVMEYVAGYSVGDWIRRKTRISEGDALLTADYVADALHYAWKTQRMIHCDIKPDNIMIDDDGTIKVADLGLSKTIGISGAGEVSDEVMGTPNYMSPEQVMGDASLDCRADIYSLGAMLYHMLAGKMLFQEYGDSEAMEQQVKGRVPDPLDLNPDLSMGTCWMIEKMLAKDRNNRQTDWDGVLSDIPRVLKGKLPAGVVIPADASTVTRSQKRNRLRGKRVARIGGDIRQTRPLRTATFAWMPVLATAFVVTLIAGTLFWLEPWNRIDYVFKPPPEIPVTPVVNPRIAKGEAAYKSALAWTEAHPDDYDGAMQMFEKVAADFERTGPATMALAKVGQLKSAKDRAVTETLAGLEDKTADLVKAKRFDEAAALVRDYSGKFAGETGETRKGIEQDIRRQAAEFAAAAELAAKNKELKVVALLTAAADKLIADGVTAALRLMERTMKEQGLDDFMQIADTIQLLRKMETIDAGLLKSFKSQEGRTITVSMREGSKTVKVLSVADGKVRCEEQMQKDTYTVARPLDLDLDQLSVGEMAGRLGPGSQDEVLFKKGTLALQAKAFGLANQCFSKTSSALSPRLTQKTAELSVLEAGNAEEQALVRLMRACGVNVPDKYSEPGWRAILAGTRFPAGDPRLIEAKVDAYRKEQGNSATGRSADHLLVMLVAKAKADAAKAVAVAMEQIDEDAVRKMLLMYNRELDKESIQIAKSQRYPGYCLRVKSEQLVSLGTLRTCGNTITELDVSNSKVKDITAISGTSIRSVDISNTKVATLPMLTTVSLERLIMRGVPVKDIGPLSRTKLKELDLSDTKVSDLRPICHLPLESLALNDMGIKDKEVSLLKIPTLKRLSIRDGHVTSIAPLQKLPLESLDLSGNEGIKDFTLLAGMPLRGLALGNTVLHDLTPLSGMELTFLDISGTKVSNLAPLKGMKLVDLRISNTRISDLTPLSDMALNRFYCAGIQPNSWEPITTMPITDLVVTVPKGGTAPGFVKSLTKLRTLNGLSIKK